MSEVRASVRFLSMDRHGGTGRGGTTQDLYFPGTTSFAGFEVSTIRLVIRFGPLPSEGGVIVVSN